MTVKSILVPIAGAADDPVTMQIALDVAEKFSARIEVLYAQSLSEDLKPVMGRGFDSSAMQQIIASAREALEKTEAKVRDDFHGLLAQIEDENAKGYAVEAILDVAEAPPGEAIIARGGVFDLLVVAHPAGAQDGASRDITEAALFHTGRPVLIVPHTRPETIGERIMIGWNRSAQAGRAVASAMPFLERARDVLIYYVETGAKQGPSPARLRDYLALHDIEAELVEQLPDQRSIGEILISEGKNAGVDLIVMGAYSKSRLRERVLGGVTDHIFSVPSLPLLMAR